MNRKSNRELAEQVVDRMRPRLVALLEEVLAEDRGAEDEVPRVPGISQEGYQKALAMAARWQSGGGRKKKAVRQTH